MEHVPIEHLTKQQIVLLTLFVAFVASIASGITVVALLDQAPQAVTQGINQVVEQTIEKVIPVETPVTVSADSGSPAAQQTVTVQVGQDDLAAAAISQGVKSLARLYQVTGGQRNFIGMGIVIDATGTIATDKALFSPDQSYIAVVDGGPDIYLSSIPLDVSGDSQGIGFFSPINATPQGSTVVPASLATTTPQLGQTIVALVGQTKDTVEQGIVSSLDTASDGSVTGIETTLDSSALIDGSPIVGLDGKIAGITIASSGSVKNIYIPSTLISKAYPH